jgi:hypothetical protein
MQNKNMLAEDHWLKESTADWKTVEGIEIGNGAIVSVTFWLDDFKKPDWNKPATVCYNSVKVNDLLADSQWILIEQQIDDIIEGGW